MTINPDFVSISVEEYARLLDAEKKLYCLECGGVDNWEYYSDALRDGGYFDEDEEDE